jgi:hypothetical protein
MDRTRPEFIEFQEVQFSSVTFVLAKAILRKLSAKVTHDLVARHLGDHAGGGDAQADAITIDDRRLRQRKRNHRQAIDQDMVGRLDQGFDGHAHGTMARAQDVNPIDLDGINNPDSPSHFEIRSQFAIDFLAQLRRELFRIVQSPVPEFFRKNHRGCDDRASQRAATSFVNPGNARDATETEFFLVAESAAPVHATYYAEILIVRSEM